jgi:hypothetical protein
MKHAYLVLNLFVLGAPLAGLVGFCRPAPARAQTSANVEIALDTSRAEQGRQQLKRLLREYDLDPWIFTPAELA